MNQYWHIFMEGLIIGAWVNSLINSLFKKEMWWALLATVLIAVYLHGVINAAEKVICAVKG